MGSGAVAVIDVGSNSVRLVIYERASRAPTVLFNEKVLAALGEGLAENGRLSDEAMGRALAALRRFMLLIRDADVRQVTILATAAARVATNGADFIADIERIARQKVRVLDGREEAEMAANGVLCGFWSPDGVVGDLGGGSLELIDVGDGGLGPGDSFPLGTLRLKNDAGNALRRGCEIVTDMLSGSRQLPLLAGRTFYAVGGTWRSLVRLHMAVTNYPLSVMHHYSVPGAEMAAFCERILSEGVEGLDEDRVISKGRRSLVPWGAAVLKAIVEIGKPDQVVASALGVREGLIYSGLDAAERRRDPLLLATEELALLRARSPQHATELIEWAGAAFRTLGLRETEEEERLRVAACLLSDIGWRAHPDYRGDQALAIVSNAALYGVDHPGRSYIARVLHDRYGGIADPRAKPAVEGLCSPRMEQRAKVLAAVCRVAYVLAPGTPGVLPRIRLLRDDDTIVLWLPEDLAGLEGERPLRRMRQLARLVNAQAEIRSGGA
ncbi:Ppx/GppA phosphatase family protein [Acuticoccus mangrovi]|uniref:Ppx/GppA family phosphatase n=1 Tax=Acuticoccus mangrovi TaxID=2796142 RepID=A0A934IRI0_9HYPH|nr:Ppx/GppA phosphatase family protein [Acuticoccus mangrovi]MBJ3777396.1 Ppx/GppA family phosphatase [Acuticoccus mangrovi]